MPESLNMNNKIDKAELNSSVKLFEQTSIFRSLLKVVFLAVVVSFVSGLYVFVDQVLMTKILPINQQNFVENTLTQLNWYELVEKIKNGQVIDNFNLMSKFMTEKEAITSIIRVVNSSVSPIALICTALSLLIGLGTAIPYSKALGSKDYQKINDVWKNGFYNALVIGIATSIIFIGLTFVIVPLQISDKAQSDIDINIKNFLEAKRNISIKYGINYGLIILAFNIFNVFLMLFVSLLNSEGKNTVPTIVVLIANFINIFLDFMLLYYSKLGMNGSAIATGISYIVSIIIFYFYLFQKNKKNETFLVFKNLKLKGFKINWSIIFFILAVGSSSFFRNASTALFSLTQQSLYSSITNEVTLKDSNYYVDILGAITPIFNLFFSAIIGIIRGARTVVSYNHGMNNNKNVLKAFWITNIMSCCYGLLFYLLVCPILLNIPGLNGGFLWFFEIGVDSSLYKDASLLLHINMSQLIIFSLSISGMLYFQSTGKPINALFTSLMNGLIIGIPVLLINSQIAKQTQNINIYIYSPIIISFLSGIIVFSYTIWYIYFKKNKKMSK